MEPLLGKHPTGDLKTVPLTGWKTTIPSGSLYVQLRTWHATHLDDDQYLSWYVPNGRPSKPPSLVITLTLLQFRTGVSDREAVATAQDDNRWKFALGLSRDPEITLDRSTSARYRGRLLADDCGRKWLKQTLADAAEAGLLGPSEDLIDWFCLPEQQPAEGL